MVGAVAGRDDDRLLSAAQREGILLVAGLIKCRDLGVDLTTMTRSEANRLRMRLEWEWRHGEPPPDGEDPPAPDLRHESRAGLHYRRRQHNEDGGRS